MCRSDSKQKTQEALYILVRRSSNSLVPKPFFLQDLFLQVKQTSSSLIWTHTHTHQLCLTLTASVDGLMSMLFNLVKFGQVKMAIKLWEWLQSAVQGRAQQHSCSNHCSPLVPPTRPNTDTFGLNTKLRIQRSVIVKPISRLQHGYW